jgi:hypothetical protein
MMGHEFVEGVPFLPPDQIARRGECFLEEIERKK